MSNRPADALEQVFRRHPRNWRENLYVYPVISRRSGGLSIGVNLNPDKACNFDCLYCQVDRTVPPAVRRVDPDRLRLELESMIQVALGGDLFKEPPFDRVPAGMQRVRDIAFSGDGEPTTSPQFPYAVDLAAELRQRWALKDARLVLITDAAYLDKPAVRGALAVMDANNGEIWAKLDAGTEEYYRLINRPNVPLKRVLDNITGAARVRPIVIQSLWMNYEGSPPSEGEVDAFARRLREIVETGGAIRLVQVYTIARTPADRRVTPLDPAALNHVADRVRRVIDLPLETYA